MWKSFDGNSSIISSKMVSSARIGFLARRVEAIVREALHGLIFAGLVRIAQFGNGLQHGEAMAGNVDFRDHFDAETSGERHEAAHRVFCVEAAIFLRAGAEQRRNGQAVAAPRADLGQRRIGVDFDAPGLVVGQMPVEAVELVPGHDGEELADLGGGVKLPRRVKMAAAPCHGGLVDDLALGREAVNVRVQPRAAQHLCEGDQAVEKALMRGRMKADLVWKKIEAIGFGGKRGVLCASDSNTAFGGSADESFNWKQAQA